MGQGEPDGERGRGGDVPVLPAALAAVARLRAAAEEVMALPLWMLSDPEACLLVDEMFAGMNQSFAGYLRVLLELDSRPGAVEGARPDAVGQTYARHRLRRSPWQAAADMQLARALAPDADPAEGGLPRLWAALAAGEVSREHGHVAVKALNKVPDELLAEPMTPDEVAGSDLAGEQSESQPGSGTGTGEAGTGEAGTGEAGTGDEAAGRKFCRGDLLDRLLTDQCKRSDPGTIDKLGQYLQHAADPGGEKSFDPEGTQRRGLTIIRDCDGMEIIRGELDAANGAFFRAALDALSKPAPARTEQAQDGTLIEVKDHRTARQRRADAAGLMARLALDHLSSGRGSEPPRIVIHASVDELRRARQAAGAPASDAPEASTPAARGAEFADGGTVPPRVLSRLACDAVLERALLARNGAILDLGRSTRTISPAQRRALTARDQGCVIPGCTAPAHWTEGHHIRWWQRDHGPTDIGNLALLCGRHHDEVHSGTWVLEMHDGIPWARPPAWLDRERRPIRNTYHDDVETFHRTGAQLRLGFDEITQDPSPPGDPRPEQEA